MSRFSEVVRQDTPRLVVEYKREGDDDKFTWGIVGAMPLVHLIGRLARVQAVLVGDSWVEECEPSALVIAWDNGERDFNVFCNPGIPGDVLVGMLELVKAILVGTSMARRAAAQQLPILGPDGQPVGRR